MARVSGNGTDYVVGVDAGGTSTRAVAVGLDGSVLGRGASGGANPNSHPYQVAAARIADAISAAAAGLPPDRARGCVVGMAGSSKLTDPDVADVFHHAWRGIGLACDIRVVTDQEVAYASATTEPDGAVVVAGTGSIAATITNRKLAAVIGGYGWLLGDEGSAYWIGREAVRATLRAMSTMSKEEPIGPLARAVISEALGDAAVDHEFTNGFAARHAACLRLITAVNAEPPIRLARFAPLVSEHAAADPLAEDIVARTVDVLAEMAETARVPGAPVVLVGSVAGPDGPVGTRLRERLGRVLFATDGAAGAAWLAALDVLGPDAPHPRVTQAGVAGG